MVRAPLLRRPARLLMRLGYRSLKVWWFLRRPVHIEGAQVVVWHDDQILVVRHSYRKRYGLPGGKLKRGEAPRERARRELAEEVGIHADPEELQDFGPSTFGFAHGEVTTHIFEYRPEDRPAVQVDNLEVIEACFLDMEDAVAQMSNPHFLHYLTQVQDRSA